MERAAEMLDVHGAHFARVAAQARAGSVVVELTAWMEKDRAVSAELREHAAQLRAEVDRAAAMQAP